ncbi:unnamed protein product [Polarella glacialis]|uniref:Uncharacterized protein n=1 Tax=Polarella glacialis TaxID=89957 RepID=A0A813DSR5_POLGL|nr:unnamed protein product [Polarella glacialis]
MLTVVVFGATGDLAKKKLFPCPVRADFWQPGASRSPASHDARAGLCARSAGARGLFGEAVRERAGASPRGVSEAGELLSRPVRPASRFRQAPPGIAPVGSF